MYLLFVQNEEDSLLFVLDIWNELLSLHLQDEESYMVLSYTSQQVSTFNGSIEGLRSREMGFLKSKSLRGFQGCIKSLKLAGAWMMSNEPSIDKGLS